MTCADAADCVRPVKLHIEGCSFSHFCVPYNPISAIERETVLHKIVSFVRGKMFRCKLKFQPNLYVKQFYFGIISCKENANIFYFSTFLPFFLVSKVLILKYGIFPIKSLLHVFGVCFRVFSRSSAF